MGFSHEKMIKNGDVLKNGGTAGMISYPMVKWRFFGTNGNFYIFEFTIWTQFAVSKKPTGLVVQRTSSRRASRDPWMDSLSANNDHWMITTH